MGNSVRMYSKSGLYFVRATTVAAATLEPSKRLNLVLGGVLARVARKHPIGLRGFAAHRGGLTLLLSAETSSLSDFMRELLGTIARRVHALQRTKGKLWSGRFECEPVLDSTAEVDCLAAMLREALSAAQPDGWPPFTCLPWLIPGAPRPRVRFHEWNRRHKDPVHFGHVSRWNASIATDETIELERPYAWRHLDEPTVQANLRSLLEGTRLEEPRARGQAGCWASSALVRQQFQQTRRHFRQDYARASRSLRAGIASVLFPDHSFAPSYPHAPPGRKRTAPPRSSRAAPAPKTRSTSKVPVWALEPRRHAAPGR